MLTIFLSLFLISQNPGFAQEVEGQVKKEENKVLVFYKPKAFGINQFLQEGFLLLILEKITILKLLPLKMQMILMKRTWQNLIS